MADAFDPDKYLAEKRAALAAAAPPFDPDKYLAEKTGALRQASAPDDSAQPKDVTIDGPGTRLFHLARHLAFGAGDKLIAAEQAARDAYQDKTGHPLDVFAKSYGNNLAFNDKVMDASDRAHPLERWEGNLGGFLGSSAALAVPGMLAGAGEAGAQALPRAAQLVRASAEGRTLGSLVGGLGGYGGSRSDSTLGTLGNVSLGALLGYGAGAAAPYVADYAGRGAQYLGNKAQDLAGWLKVNSIHPTPTLGEAMEEVPGGKVGVGRELLERGVGGLTKGGTAQQAAQEMNKAGAAIDAVATAHDQGGGAPIDLKPALNSGLEEAQRLQAKPFTAAKAAGKRLEQIVYDYAGKLADGTASATDALAIKRELAGEAYGAGEMLKKSGDQLAGHYAKGVAALASAVDDSMDSALGPTFEGANVAFRRLLGASNAADRQAGRASANHLLGLMPAVIGGGELAAGHGLEKAGPAALAVALANKYGSQAGARTLYSLIGGGLNLAGQGLQAAPGAAASGAAAQLTSPYGVLWGGSR